MKNGRRNHGATFKARVALKAARGEKSLAEIASLYQVHPNQVRKWRKQLTEELLSIFADKRHCDKQIEEHEARLYEEIGRMKVELDWLKKNSIYDTTGEETMRGSCSSGDADKGLCISGSDNGLVQSVCALVGGVTDAGGRFLHCSIGACVGGREAGDIQQ